MGSTRTYTLLVALALLALALSCLSAPVWAQGQTTEERAISLDLRDAPIEDALRIIFRDTPYSFTLEPGVSGRITLSLNDVPFSRALRAILDMNNPKLTYRKEENVYVITTAAAQAPVQPAEIEEPASEMTVYWLGPGGRYELQYLDCRDVAAWFGGYEVGGTPQYPIAMGGGGGTGGMGGGGLGGGFGSSGLSGLSSGTSGRSGLTSGTGSLTGGTTSGGRTTGTGNTGRSSGSRK